MGTVKRAPELESREHRIKYSQMSKADIVEAYRDLFREMGGVGETDDSEWMQDLQRRITILKTYRKAWAKQDTRPIHKLLADIQRNDI